MFGGFVGDPVVVKSVYSSFPQIRRILRLR